MCSVLYKYKFSQITLMTEEFVYSNSVLTGNYAIYDKAIIHVHILINIVYVQYIQSTDRTYM